MPTPPQLSPRHALFPGTFDPVTLGHLDVLGRAARLFERVTVAVAQHPTKSELLSVAERLALLATATAELANVDVVSFDGLVVDGCRQSGAGTIVRGLRGAGDLEYELQMATTNRRMLAGLDTVFLGSSPEHAHVSSTLVRQIASLSGDVTPFVPACVAAHLSRRFSEEQAR